MEIEQLQEANSSKKRNWFKFLFFACLILITYLLYKQYDDSKKLEVAFSAKFNQLTSVNDSLLRQQISLESVIVSQKNKLESYSPYLPLLSSLKILDTAYKSLPFRYGQQVLILPDSSVGVINSISLTANQLEYSVRYLVRNKKGKLVLLSVSDIISLQ
jgi:hypothetical protein